MDVQHERRSGDDRREITLYYPYGNERRDNTDRRVFDMPGDNLPDPERVITRGYWGASEENSTAE